MDDLSLFHNFRPAVAAPSEDARRRASARLASAIEGQHRRGATLLRPIRRRPGRIALAFVAVVGAAAAALFVSSPWKTAPGLSFLEEVQAAITPPEGTILHATWTLTRTSQEYGCTVTLGPNEVWADLSPPYRFRLIDSAWPSVHGVDRRSAACDENESVTTEHGGTLSGVWVDDVTPLRKALSDGRAHGEGQVELDGRVVERIRVDGVPGDRRYFYVDPETFIPVRVEGSPGGVYYLGSLKVGPLRFGIITDYLTYEYLPRTDDNLALTDISEQVP